MLPGKSCRLARTGGLAMAPRPAFRGPTRLARRLPLTRRLTATKKRRMELTTSIALSRLTAQMRALDVSANNLSNASTSGFRAERVLFSDWLSRQTGAHTPRGGGVIAYTQDRATYRDQRAGNLTHTGNPLDLAISGEGYFTVLTSAGPRLTRAGRFTPLTDGTIADQEGDALLDDQGQKIQLADGDTEVTVAADGTISTANGQVGKIGVVTPSDANRMAQEGASNMRADTPTSPTSDPHIVQGSVEDSNVQPIMETTQMINDTREFQFLVQFIQTEADRRQNAIDKILPKS